MTATWSFVLIPDTQHLATPANGWTAYFNGLRDWIIDNTATHNIQFVGGLGDIIHLNNDDASWVNAETALLPLFDLDIPVLLFAAGNHDPDSIFDMRALTKYNAHFGPALYDDKPWYGGVYEAGHAENMWAEFTVGEHDYLAFMLEFHPRPAVMDWVATVTAAHPDHRVLVVTHSHVNTFGERWTWAETGEYGPADYFTEGTGEATSPEEAWTDWLADIPNLFGVFNGHNLSLTTLSAILAYRIDANTAGQNVLQGFYNWQETGQGGKGRVVLMTVNDATGTIRQRVVRTDLGTFETGTCADAGGPTFSYEAVHQVWAWDAPAVAPARFRSEADGSELFVRHSDGSVANLKRIAVVP